LLDEAEFIFEKFEDVAIVVSHINLPASLTVTQPVAAFRGIKLSFQPFFMLSNACASTKPATSREYVALSPANTAQSFASGWAKVLNRFFGNNRSRSFLHIIRNQDTFPPRHKHCCAKCKVGKDLKP